jgi:hypothetical protein
MPMTYKHSGKRVQVNATTARTSGAIVADPIIPAGQNTVAGIAQSNAVAGDYYWVETTGVHNITVPGGATVGALMYAPGAVGAGSGTGPTPGNGLVLTATSASNTVFGKIISPLDSLNRADVLLFHPRY